MGATREPSRARGQDEPSVSGQDARRGMGGRRGDLLRDFRVRLVEGSLGQGDQEYQDPKNYERK